MKRRDILQGAAAALVLPLLTGQASPADADAQPRDPSALIEAARRLAAAPWAPRPARLLPPFDDLNYDAFRGIRPLPGRAAGLDLGARFEADLLPPGWLFADPVSISLHNAPGVKGFDPELYALDPRYFPDGAPEGAVHDMGFSGLRLRYPLNAADRHDDLLVLQGASYFRALARDTAYGLSARGLAIGTGSPTPEEFPVTRHIAVFGSAPGALHLGCLIDSVRASAALIVTLHPGHAGAPETVMDCALHLFTREPLEDAGIAPLTSMFQHGDIGTSGVDDFRPAVHDSDVLLIDNGAGEQLWRPLTNPAHVQMSAFQDDTPRRFGLLQTPVEFERFRDAQGDYHRRPSALVSPLGNWGKGAVMLLEIPTLNEYADNIVAFWRPAAPLLPGQEHRFDYRLSWHPPGPAPVMQGAHELQLLPLRSASGVDPVDRQGRLFVLDFAQPPGHSEARMAPGDMELDIGPVDGVTISGTALYRVGTGAPGLRASFVLTPDTDTNTAEIRLRLRDARSGTLRAPVWMFRWTRSRENGP